MQAVTGLGSRVGAGVLLQLILYTAMPQLAFLPDHRCVDEVSCSTLAPCFRVEGTSSLESSAWEFKARETGQSKLTTGLCRVGILRPSISILVCVIYWGGQGVHMPQRERGGQRTTWRGWFSPPTMRIKLRSLCSAASALTH